MADKNKKLYIGRIASMTEGEIEAQIQALEAEREKTEREIERILSEIAGQTGMSELKPKAGKGSVLT